MDHRELKRLVQLMNDNGLVELEIEREGLRIHLRKAMAPPADPAAWAPTPPGDSLAGPPGPTSTSDPAAEAEREKSTVIPSPLVGTFYRRPNPDADPYVEVGDSIRADTIVCIIEAMKVNNEIKAELAGEIQEILVEDGQPVEYGQPLFRVRLAP